MAHRNQPSVQAHPIGWGVAPDIGLVRSWTCPMPWGAGSCGLVQAAREGIVLLDGRGRICAFNAAAGHIFGGEPEALSGRPFESLLHQPIGLSFDWDAHRDDVTFEPHWRQSPAGCSGLRADGSDFPISFDIARMGSAPDTGPAAGYAAFIRDLSAQSALEAELQRVDRRLRTLVELAPIAIWIAEGDQVAFANRAAGTLMGTESGASLVGHSIYSLLRDEDHAELSRQLARALSHEGRLGRLQAHLLRNDSEIREVEIALAALPDHGRTSVQMVISDVSQRNRELREIERSRQLLRRLSANVIEAREEERRRIARELHDELGQSLSALKMEIADEARSGARRRNPGRATVLQARLDDIMASVRRIAADLRPLMLDDLGLGDAIEALVNDFAQRSGIRVRLAMDGLEPAPDEKVSIALYRMVQEALTNVTRHSRATEVGIDLRRDGDDLVLAVQDNGVGLPASPSGQRDNQFGLLGMQKRADALGGDLQLENQPGGGARVTMRLPLVPTGPAGADGMAAQGRAA